VCEPSEGVHTDSCLYTVAIRWTARRLRISQRRAGCMGHAGVSAGRSFRAKKFRNSPLTGRGDVRKIAAAHLDTSRSQYGQQKDRLLESGGQSSFASRSPVSRPLERLKSSIMTPVFRILRLGIVAATWAASADVVDAFTRGLQPLRQQRAFARGPPSAASSRRHPRDLSRVGLVLRRSTVLRAVSSTSTSSKVKHSLAVKDPRYG
jgi:hypothetical protein